MIIRLFQWDNFGRWNDTCTIDIFPLIEFNYSTINVAMYVWKSMRWMKNKFGLLYIFRHCMKLELTRGNIINKWINQSKENLLNHFSKEISSKAEIWMKRWFYDPNTWIQKTFFLSLSLYIYCMRFYLPFTMREKERKRGKKGDKIKRSGSQMSFLIESIKISSKSDSINATMDNLINELRVKAWPFTLGLAQCRRCRADFGVGC